jgi:hypothetical protein
MEHPLTDFHPDEGQGMQKARPPERSRAFRIYDFGLGDQPRVRERIMKLS